MTVIIIGALLFQEGSGAALAAHAVAALFGGVLELEKEEEECRYELLTLENRAQGFEPTDEMLEDPRKAPFPVKTAGLGLLYAERHNITTPSPTWPWRTRTRAT